MLNLEAHHKSYLQRIGFLNSTIDAQMYRSIPKKKIKRRLIANSLKRKYDLAGIPRLFSRGRLVLDFFFTSWLLYSTLR